MDEQIDRVQEFLKTSTSKTLRVRELVAFPGATLHLQQYVRNSPPG